MIYSGMSTSRDRVRVKVTHIPSGISASVSSTRSQHKNKEKALEVLRNKLHALNTMTEDAGVLVSCYDLPDSVEFPNFLGEHKSVDINSQSVIIKTLKKEKIK